MSHRRKRRTDAPPPVPDRSEDRWAIVVRCRSERERDMAIEKLTADGYEVRVMKP